MVRKINSNKNGVIEYAIDSVEDLNNLPRKETDNTVYAILNKDGKRLVYLYSKAEKDYILINGDLEEINEQLDNKANNINFVYSKIKADGVTDDSSVLQNEINSLNPFDCLITPKGVSVLNTTVLSSTKTNIILDFTATKFVEGVSTPAIILRLNDSEVRNLFIDGNRQNKTFDDTKFGTDFLFKIDNNCSNVKFTGTTKIINAPFCGIMWGQNCKNIQFDNLVAEEIGEHVQYKTGKIELDNDIDNIVYKNVNLKNIGINNGNVSAGHFVQFFKVANDDNNSNVGLLKNVIIENLNLNNVSNKVECCVFSCFNIENCYVYNVSGNVDALISGGNIKNVCAYNSRFKRVFISNADLKSSEGIKLYNCEFDYVPHVNLVNLYDNCKFNLYFTSSQINEGVIKDKKTTFNNCTFKINTSCNYSHMYNNVDFYNCSFISTATNTISSSMLNFGEAYTSDGATLTIKNGINDANNFSFLFSFRNVNMNVSVSDIIATNRIRSAFAIKSINIQNVLYKIPGEYYTPVLTDLDSAVTKSIINCKTSKGNILDNYISGATQTVVIGDKTLVIKNGLIQSVT